MGTGRPEDGKNAPETARFPTQGLLGAGGGGGGTLAYSQKADPTDTRGPARRPHFGRAQLRNARQVT